MKNILRIGIILASIFLLLSCNKEDDEIWYGTKFYYYSWDTDSLDIPSSAFNQTFQIKGMNGEIGCIDGVMAVFSINEQDTVIIDDIDSALPDTIRGDWFTIINEEKQQLRVILDENKGTQMRTLTTFIWGTHLTKHPIEDGHPTMGGMPLVIWQQPSKKE